MQVKLIVMFLGKRGGGLRFTQEVVSELLAKNFKVALITNHSISETNAFDSDRNTLNLEIFYLDINSPKSILELLSWIRRLKQKNYTYCLNTMMSFRDFLPLLLLRFMGFYRGQVIHDATRHPGDLYPPTFAIKIRAYFSHQIFTLSQKTTKEMLKLGRNVYKLNFFPPSRRNQAKRIAGLISTVGRGRKYQGFNRVNEISHLMEHKNYFWVVVGKGVNPKISPEEKVIQISTWLEDKQMSQILAQSQIVVLPYIEASQSGILQQCLSYGVPVVVPPLEGLSEFIIDGINGYISEENTNASLARTCDRALNANIGEIAPANIDLSGEIFSAEVIDSINRLVRSNQRNDTSYDEK